MNYILDYWPIITMAAVLIFDWGVLFQKIKTSPTEKRVEEMIDKKLNGHCPNTLPLKSIELKVQKFEKRLNDYQHSNDLENRQSSLALQEIRINIKNICFHLGIDYQNGNNNHK
jgi:hypothetical protein